MNKKILFPVMALAVLAGGFLTATNAFADDSLNPHGAIVQKIADKFGLNKDEVQKVFDEERTARQAEMQTKQEERLNQLVSDGKITKEQKTLILSKQKELGSNRAANKNSMKDKTPDERKSEMESKKVELEAWATKNGIDTQYLFGFGMKGHGKFGPKM